MKKFLRKSWHGIPVGLIATLLLVTTVAASAYMVLTGVIGVDVGEPITVEVAWDQSTYVTIEDGFSETITGAYANDSWDFNVRVSNASNNDITATLTYDVYYLDGSSWVDAAGDITLTGSNLIGSGVTVPANSNLVRTITGYIAADAEPGTYKIQANFTRG